MLPFVNMSADKEQEYFADGISEELLNLLAQVPELRVIARTSSFSFKGKDVDIAEIARRLNVANVLEGSVRKSGDTLRITAQLVRASDSSHLWSQTYDRQMTDVFTVQDEIAAAVVDATQDQAARRRTDDAGQPIRGPTRCSCRLARSAVSTPPRLSSNRSRCTSRRWRIDPAYARGMGWAGRIYYDQVDDGLRRVDEGIRLAREATKKALALDPRTRRRTPPRLDRDLLRPRPGSGGRHSSTR